MTVHTERAAASRRHRSARWRAIGYWVTTGLLASELGVGGIWDLARLRWVGRVVADLGYPSYFLVLLGAWKVGGAVAVLIPRRPLLKEWAYAGAFFTYTGAIVSHVATGRDLVELVPLIPITVVTVTSWALRPDSRRTPGPGSGSGTSRGVGLPWPGPGKGS